MADPTNQPTPMPRVGLTCDPNASESEQILGITAHQHDPTREKIAPKWHRLYDKLIGKRDELIDTIKEASEKAREISPDPIQREPADVGTATFQQDELLGSATLDQELLEEVNEAISRMENGSYGVCQLTGEPIPMERLEAIPWTRFTLEAQEKMESEGTATKAAIGPLGNLNERGTAPPGRWRKHEGSA